MKIMHFNQVSAFFLLWLLPVLLAFYIYAANRRRKTLQIFADQEILQKINPYLSYARRNFKIFLMLLALFLMIFALAGPGWDLKSRLIKRKGRDVVFMIDVSKSMLAADLAPNRLERAKLAVLDCVEQLQGDRVALVVFAGSSVVKCPLTLDYGFFRAMVQDISVQSIHRGGTKIGDALRKVLNEVFDDLAKQYKDIILITDGEDHESMPIKAAEEAGQRKIRLIAIGLGDENIGRRIQVIGENGQKTFLKFKDQKGQLQEVWTKLDAHALRKMANATPGGKYLNVATGSFDLGAIYKKIMAASQKKELEATSIQRYEAQFQIFVFLAFLLLSLELVIHTRKGRQNHVLSLFNRKK